MSDSLSPYKISSLGRHSIVRPRSWDHTKTLIWSHFPVVVLWWITREIHWNLSYLQISGVLEWVYQLFCVLLIISLTLYHNVLVLIIIIIIQQQLRLLVVIDDVDTDPVTGAPVQESILGLFPITEISRPSAPNATFTNTRTFSGANSLTLTYQYRVICSAGTCGSDCSQTSNCQPFPSCVPVTCADSPCMNGGTCSDVSQLIIV